MLHLLYGGADSTIINNNNNFNNDCKMAKHDENRDLRSFSRVGKVDYSNKTLQASKSSTIGIHMWGKIDFLTKYCGWHFVWNNSAGVGLTKSNDDNTNSASTAKKAKKETKLTDKTKKTKKK